MPRCPILATSKHIVSHRTQRLLTVKNLLAFILEYAPVPPAHREPLTQLSRLECLESLFAPLNPSRLLANHTTSLSNHQYLQLLAKSKYLALPDINKPVWDKCRGSIPNARGCELTAMIAIASSTRLFRYTCGLWLLFHTMLAEVTRDTPPVDDALPARLLFTIRGMGGDWQQCSINILVDYISHFFGCLECREHFCDMAKDLQSEVRGLDHVRHASQSHQCFTAVAGRGNDVAVAGAQSRQLSPV